MNKGITVNELFKVCKAMVDKGYGDRHVQISRDDEGNSFHSLFYTFTYNDEDLEYYLKNGMLPYGIDNTKEIIILG